MTAVKLYLKWLATFAILWLAFLLVMTFFGLCFYESFSWRQAALQVGGQVVIVIVGGLLAFAFERMWFPRGSR